jgi:hypothetical protein
MKTIIIQVVDVGYRSMKFNLYARIIFKKTAADVHPRLTLDMIKIKGDGIIRRLHHQLNIFKHDCLESGPMTTESVHGRVFIEQEIAKSKGSKLSKDKTWKNTFEKRRLRVGPFKFWKPDFLIYGQLVAKLQVLEHMKSTKGVLPEPKAPSAASIPMPVSVSMYANNSTET